MTADGPPALVEDYRPGDFLLAGPSATLLATGCQAVVTEPDPDELAARVGKLLLDTAVPVAVGVLPFDTDAQPRLVIPAAVRRGGPASSRPATPWTHAPRVTPIPEPAAYVHAVEQVVRRLRSDSDLRKVVLARAIELEFDDAVDIARLLPGLAAANPIGFTYAADLGPVLGGRALLGASPELLLRRTGDQVVSNPLAGSVPRGIDAVADEKVAAALLASAKDQGEHRVVVEAVVEVLRPFCRRLTVPATPSLVKTPTVWHLSTRITGELIDPDVSALRLAAALHPTPAVCGTPTAAARAVIAEHEPFDRGFYSGVVGWCDAAGDGEWVVAIRCAEVEAARMRLFAGAGIMPDSVPAAELAETDAKFRTLLAALGVTL
ncbi:isochorismate synthase [Actinokineospora alba]|uniref:isochorismate synthase n=1 Tax=Actinokineospora alba TaxID=504798 RepID=A0A1H0S7K1_9PSEU|nr:isochorismate synthase [Actinokineospora alba]TDP66736.1 isochorismate synthase [Actinokineospora alba]SDI50712.1 isochorismate synthase [Actinokineospora alba]SDP37519.1 isochorismate synthase [Actinokineospora alba]